MSEQGRRFGRRSTANRHLALEGVRADLHVLAGVRRHLAEFASEVGLPPDTATDVLLATYEALANVAEHAYPPGEPGTFDLFAEHSEAAVFTVTVVDRGSWKPESDNRATRRGQGIRLMRACSDGVRVDRRDGGTQVRLQWNYGDQRRTLPEREQRVEP